MSERTKRIYVDTSVVLGNFDIGETRRLATDVFWNAVRSGEIVAIVSDVLRGELKDDVVERVLLFWHHCQKIRLSRALQQTNPTI